MVLYQTGDYITPQPQRRITEAPVKRHYFSLCAIVFCFLLFYHYIVSLWFGHGLLKNDYKTNKVTLYTYKQLYNLWAARTIRCDCARLRGKVSLLPVARCPLDRILVAHQTWLSACWSCTLFIIFSGCFSCKR